MEYILKEYTQEEYTADMKKKLKEKGLHDAVKERCDEINEIITGMPYLPCRHIQEILCDILFLIKLDQKKDDGEIKNIDKENDMRYISMVRMWGKKLADQKYKEWIEEYGENND